MCPRWCCVIILREVCSVFGCYKSGEPAAGEIMGRLESGGQQSRDLSLSRYHRTNGSKQRSPLLASPWRDSHRRNDLALVCFCIFFLGQPLLWLLVARLRVFHSANLKKLVDHNLSRA